jgi:hypothetical protein
VETYVALFSDVGKDRSFIPAGIGEGPAELLRWQTGPHPALVNFSTGATSRFTNDSIFSADDPICVTLTSSQLKRRVRCMRFERYTIGLDDPLSSFHGNDIDHNGGLGVVACIQSAMWRGWLTFR